ncbi:hypothetical protein [Nonomuraea sp. CA-141351]|uniref:phage terminase small subunit n=1 Tax=Nonomuraea sp. CA-141351 TaxID=3239996 RepID=UPI003D8D16BB
MAGRGPAPKQERIRRNADPVGSIALTSDAVVKAPKLPGYTTYSAKTRAWWDTWAASPQAQAFAPTDWQRLIMLAPLVEQYHQEPKAALLSEIRLNEERMGALVADRQRLRMTLPGLADDKPKLAPVRDLAARRKNLED